VTGSHKPVIWATFAAGGTVAAFIIPVLIFITCLAVPLGLLPAEALYYERVLDLLQHPLSKFITFAVLFPVVWHAAHRLRITAHDLGIRSDTLVACICYGVAAAGTIFMLLALIGI